MTFYSSTKQCVEQWKTAVCDDTIKKKTRAIKLLEQPMKVFERALERGSDVRYQWMICSLVSCLERVGKLSPKRGGEMGFEEAGCG